MTCALLHHTTRVAVMIEDDTGNIAQLLTAVAALVALLVTVAALVKPFAIFAGDVLEAATFAAKVLAIGFNALAFGLGVRI